ncbi:MAG: hypothetical protein J4432_00690 [DPANN group archaeon]|nr:hypothetical protein [DPANN group archaeon]
MRLLHAAVFLILLMSTAIAITQTDPTIETQSSKTVFHGDTANYRISITNNEATSKAFKLTISENPQNLPIRIPTTDLTIQPKATKAFDIFIDTTKLSLGTYTFGLSVSKDSDVFEGPFTLQVQGASGDLSISSAYKTLEVTQGEYKELRFTVTNRGAIQLKNLILTSNLPAEFLPKYPEPFNLAASERREVKIGITTQDGAAVGERDFRIEAASGNVEASTTTTLRVQKSLDLTQDLILELLLPWDPIKENGNVIGYQIPYRLTNRGDHKISQVSVDVLNVSPEWTVEKNRPIDLDSKETKDFTLRIIPTTLEDTQAIISMSQNMQPVENVTINLAGYKVGAASSASGNVIMGGSGTAGIMLILVFVLGFLVYKQRNEYKEKLQDVKRQTYLDQLADDITKEMALDDPKEIFDNTELRPLKAALDKEKQTPQEPPVTKQDAPEEIRLGPLTLVKPTQEPTQEPTHEPTQENLEKAAEEDVLFYTSKNPKPEAPEPTDAEPEDDDDDDASASESHEPASTPAAAKPRNFAEVLRKRK